MRANKLLIASLIAAGMAASTAAQADTRARAGMHYGTPAPQDVRVVPVRHARAAQPAHAYGHGYWTWNGYRHVWVDAPLIAPSPYHVPVLSVEDGRFLYWEDLSGDVPRTNVEALRQNYRSQRD